MYTYPMDLGIEGKVAMVAAASQGMGFAIAEALAAEGARVSMAARKAETIGAAAVRIAERTGAQAMGSVSDVTSVDAIEALHRATVERFGGVDMLVTNSGGPPAGPASHDLARIRGGRFDAFHAASLEANDLASNLPPRMRARS